jgi:hypothetical protein
VNRSAAFYGECPPPHPFRYKEKKMGGIIKQKPIKKLLLILVAVVIIFVLIMETEGTLMKIITLHPLAIMVEGFYASASEIRRTWDTSSCDSTRN